MCRGLILAATGFACCWQAVVQSVAAADVEITARQVVAKDYCAWPNVVTLGDGRLAAIIFNRPSHGRSEGEVECWTSADGRAWQKTGNPMPHDAGTNRMNVAAGLNRRGEMVVLSSGWKLGPPSEKDGKPTLVEVLRSWSSLSSDGGRTWRVERDALPERAERYTHYIPFGDIFSADDGSLRAAAYARDGREKRDDVWMFRSDDDGHSWKRHALIAAEHNETALFHLGRGGWLAAARRYKERQPCDMFRSDDDGQTWTRVEQVTEAAQHPADFLLLKDGRLLLTYGNRQPGKFGVAARLSDDRGRTWGSPFTLVDDCRSTDCGYPAGVQRPDGSVLTGFYADGTPQHAGYQFSTVEWRLPPPAAK